jgi:hypothetical protein
MEKRDLNRKLKELKEVDLRELAQILEEVSVVSQRIHFYMRFMQTRGLLASTEMNTRLKELLSVFYLSFEAHFTVQSIRKALRIDKFDASEDLVSSSVEDSFFIFKKVTMRAILSYDTDLVCSVLNVLVGLIEAEYLKDLEKRVDSLKREESKIGLVVILNNLSVSIDYLRKLVEDAENEAGKLNEFDSNAKEKISSCLQPIQALQLQFKRILEGGVDALFTATVKGRLKQLFADLFQNYSLRLSEEEYQQLIDSSFKLEPIFRQDYYEFLTEDNLLRLLQQGADVVTHEFERLILSAGPNRVNAYGAMRLEKDLRTIFNQLSQLAPHVSLRDKFTSIFGFCQVLNLESSEEVAEYQDSLRLSQGEIRRLCIVRFGK